MTADSLDSVISNVPDWLKRLEELNGQIEQRQLDLAKFSGQPPSPSTKSLRNRGSTESLKPQDDGPAFPTPVPDPTTDQVPRSIITSMPPQTPDGNRRSHGQPPPSTPASDPYTSSSLIRHTNDLKATAERRARATVRKKQKTGSMVSAEGPPKYRTRGMVLVYYDSYVQSFFEELVKFVSAQRNLMRKAKMAAKVAHIKRLAEFEMPEDDDEDDAGELKPGNHLIAASPVLPAPVLKPDGADEPKLQYRSTRNYTGPLRNSAYNNLLGPGKGGMRTSGLNGGLGTFNEKNDIWDELDKGLETVQKLCEHAAHQFLRDGDCNDEVDKINVHLAKVKEAAIKEKERAAAENENNKNHPRPSQSAATGLENGPVLKLHNGGPTDPLNLIPDTRLEMFQPVPDPVSINTRDLVPETGAVKSRTFRPSTMRRDFGASALGKFTPRESPLEIDEGISVDIDDFKPVYRSTRLMRNRV